MNAVKLIHRTGIRFVYVAYSHCNNFCCRKLQCTIPVALFTPIERDYSVMINKDKWSSFRGFKLLATLAFLWPVKKSAVESEKKVDKKKVLIENADNLYENGHYQQCYSLLLTYEDDTDVEVTWRIVRALYNMAKDSAKADTEKKETILKAYNMISQCLKRYEDHFAVHKWYALLLDAKSAYEGTKQRIHQLENVKKHMERASTLNPNDATTLYMLGEWCYQIADMPWYQRQIASTLYASPPHSTYEEALDYFLKAEAVDPRFYSLNLLMIGKTYLKLAKEERAKYYLNLAASYPAKSNEDHQANKEAADLLKKLK